MRAIETEALGRAKRLAAGHPDVKGVDFGILYRDGKRRGRTNGIRFHVSRKRPESELSEGTLLPNEIGGIPCDVVIGTYEPHAPDRLAAVDPAMPGISIGNVPRQGTGTLGCFVRDNTDGSLCVLSNWHVLCGSTEAEAGDMISQPGPRHLGLDPARPIARLRRWADLAHGIDAAIAQIGDGFRYDLQPLDVPARPIAAAEPKVGMQVVKSGAISGATHGLIDGIEGSYPMDYSPYGDTSRWMDGVRIVPNPAHPASEISLGGDSGSVWLDIATGAAVGLHFAGEDGLGPQSEYALAHPMPVVCVRLRIDISSD